MKMRFLFTFLLFIVFFLAGVVFGMSNTNQPNELTAVPTEEIVIEETEEVREQEELIVYPSVYEEVKQDKPVHGIEKIAFGLEAIVIAFYEGLVYMLHAISEQFF